MRFDDLFLFACVRRKDASGDKEGETKNALVVKVAVLNGAGCKR